MRQVLAHDRRLFVPWLVLAGVCSAAMWLYSGEETIPYHLGWVAVAVAYAIEPWPWRRTVVAVLTYTAVTGGVMVQRASEGVIGWEETTEIPFMALLIFVVVANVKHRHDAYAELSRATQEERLRADQRERLARMTSHEMRTPATIALGYTELLLAGATDDALRADLQVVHDELGRLVLAGDRLVRMIQVQAEQHPTGVDVDALLEETAERWKVLADRVFLVDSAVGPQTASPHRLRACLDTLLENAVRYTEDGDVVRLSASVVGEQLLVGVADSGPGLDARLTARVNGGLPLPHDDERWTTADPKARTGFGLALVQECALARGGRLVAGRSAEGGAFLAVAVPRLWDGLRPRPRVPCRPRPSAYPGGGLLAIALPQHLSRAEPTLIGIPLSPLTRPGRTRRRPPRRRSVRGRSRRRRPTSRHCRCRARARPRPAPGRARAASCRR